MPTNRKRRKRQTEHPPVTQRLLDGLPIEKTPENRRQLIALKYFAAGDYQSDAELGEKIERLAVEELRRWSEDH